MVKLVYIQQCVQPIVLFWLFSIDSSCNARSLKKEPTELHLVSATQCSFPILHYWFSLS